MAVDLFNRHFDFPVLLAIREAFESGTWDGWMRAVTALGDHGAVWIALGVALLLFRRTRLTGAAILLALTLVALVGNMGLKPLFDRLRPCDIMGFTLLPACPPDPSFPSGHTAASFASAAVLWLRRSAFFRPALVLAALIAFSRLYLFVHFPTDVMACSGSAAPGAPRGALNSLPTGAADASSNRTVHDEKGPHPRGMRTDRAV